MAGPLCGGTLKYLMELAGARVEAGESTTDREGRYAHCCRLTATVRRPASRAPRWRREQDQPEVDLLSIVQVSPGSPDGGWVVDDGDNCGLNHEDIIGLVLFLHGEV